MKLKLYGTKGRIISALAVVTAFTGSLETSGVLNLLPEKYWWVAPAVTATSALVAGFSERIQGGASKATVRLAAQRAAQKRLAMKRDIFWKEKESSPATK